MGLLRDGEVGWEPQMVAGQGKSKWLREENDMEWDMKSHFLEIKPIQDHVSFKFF